MAEEPKKFVVQCTSAMDIDELEERLQAIVERAEVRGYKPTSIAGSSWRERTAFMCVLVEKK